MNARAFLTVVEHSGSFPRYLHGVRSSPVSTGDQGSQLSLLQKALAWSNCQAGLLETFKQFIQGLKVPFPGRIVDNCVIPVVIHTVEIINKFLHTTFQRRGRIHYSEWHFKELI